MPDHGEFGAFLVSRRGRVTPEQVGVTHGAARRRVTGLRRDEVARLAGISVDYYIQLERGQFRSVSDAVVHSLAAALQLDEAERAYLLQLARPDPVRPPVARPSVRPEVQHLLDAITGAAAFVRSHRLDVLAANAVGRALYDEAYEAQGEAPNLVRFVFLDPRARRFYRDWSSIADTAVGHLRVQSARNDGDDERASLIDELREHSDEFRARWEHRDVAQYRRGVQRFHHRLVGDLDLEFEAFDLTPDPGQGIVVYTPLPGSPSAFALAALVGDRTAPSAPPGRHR